MRVSFFSTHPGVYVGNPISLSISIGRCLYRVSDEEEQR